MPGTRRLAVFFVSCGYAGYLPLVPGTWGSALGAGIILLSPAIFGRFWATVMLTGLLAALAVVVLNSMADEGGHRDPGFVVVDELIGIFVTMAGHRITLATVVAGFLLFRIFDIVKPFPVRQAEGLPGGWGIVADDVLAGVYASLLLFLGEWLW